MFKTSKTKDKKLSGKNSLNKENSPGTPETPDHSPDPASCPTMSPAKPRLKRNGQVCCRMLSLSIYHQNPMSPARPRLNNSGQYGDDDDFG